MDFIYAPYRVLQIWFFGPNFIPTSCLLILTGSVHVYNQHRLWLLALSEILMENSCELGEISTSPLLLVNEPNLAA
jgi:hypothetical protein